MRLVTNVRTLIAASVMAAVTASAQVTVGVPGNTGNGNFYPFGSSGGYTKFQQIYASTLFTSPFSIGTISFYSKPGTEIMQQGTFTFYLNTTSTAPSAPVSFSNPSLNEVAANRKLFGSFVIGAGVDAPNVLSFTGSAFNYNPVNGNLVLDVDFAPVGSIFATGRAAFDTYYDSQVSTISDPQAFFGGTAGARGSGLVTTFAAPIAAVPEPSTVLLMSAGLAGVLAVARRKRVA